MNEQYEAPEMEIIEIVDDVITPSGDTPIDPSGN